MRSAVRKAAIWALVATPDMIASMAAADSMRVRSRRSTRARTASTMIGLLIPAPLRGWRAPLLPALLWPDPPPPPAGADAGEGAEQLADSQRLGEDGRDAMGAQLVRRHFRPETGHEKHRHLRSPALHRARHLPAGEPGHGHVGEHHVEQLPPEPGHRLGAVRAHHGLVAGRGQEVAQHLAHLRLVVHHQTAERRNGRARWRRRVGGPLQAGRRGREAQEERGAPPHRALHGHLRLVAGQDPVGHGEPEPGALRPLGGEERVEDLPPEVGRDAHPAIGHRQLHPVARLPVREGEGAAVGHRVERIQDQVDERLAQLGGVPEHVGPPGSSAGSTRISTPLRRASAPQRDSVASSASRTTWFRSTG